VRRRRDGVSRGDHRGVRRRDLPVRH
jgi:hypothetical protein